ncbi:MAG: aminopeptidase [Oligoflexia bacterium]|nr:aminopeptidase [Oligoflexia bacterium]
MVSSLLACVSSAAGCSSVQYLYQAGKGQLEIQNKAKPIDDVIRDETTPPRIRELLAEIPKIKKFGESQGLKATPNYREYVKLNRAAASWVVSACAPLKFEPKTWSFPIVGSFSYLGWFSLDDAKKYAAELRQAGWDVDLRGASAYSTLGWFRDPVLSSMLSDGDSARGDLVNVVLHESTHATLYIGGQSSFNESLAEFVAGKMTSQYFETLARSPDAREREQTLKASKAYLDSEKRGDEIEKRLHDAYEVLDKLYGSAKPDSEKLAEKKELLAKLKDKLGFKREINNATLIGYRTYNTGLDSFERLYKACQEDWRRFFAVLSKLSSRSFQASQQTDLEPILGPLSSQCR